MKLIFNIDDIRYLQLKYNDESGKEDVLKLAFKVKSESDMTAIVPVENAKIINTPSEVELSFFCENSTYTTKAILKSIKTHNESVYYTFENPAAIDYKKNREYFRVHAKYDCIYTLEIDGDYQSYNAVTHDISAGGVSIIMDENIISRTDAKLLLMLDGHNIRSSLKFLRSELYGEKSYKLSFSYIDLSEKHLQILENFCIDKQLKNSET